MEETFRLTNVIAGADISACKSEKEAVEVIVKELHTYLDKELLDLYEDMLEDLIYNLFINGSFTQEFIRNAIREANPLITDAIGAFEYLSNHMIPNPQPYFKNNKENEFIDEVALTFLKDKARLCVLHQLIRRAQKEQDNK